MSQRKINWLSLENRVAKVLHSFSKGDTESNETCIRIDAIFADELGRGSCLDEDGLKAASSYLPKGITVKSIRDKEWPE